MAYDEQLADRVRAILETSPEIEEKKMFGGLAFLYARHMAVVVSGEGGLMVRVEPSEAGELVEATPAYPAEMRGRVMTGWLRLRAADLDSDDTLEAWVERGRSFAASLPAK